MLNPVDIKVSEWCRANDYSAWLGSYWSRFSSALRAGVITNEEYNDAKERHGRLWNYAGD